MIKITKIKVLHFELSNTIGGIESLLLNLYNNINKNKYEFDFVTQYDNPAFEKEITALGGHIYKVHPWKQVALYCKDISKLLNKNYSLIHIHKNSAVNILPYILAQKKYKYRIISHAHNTAPSNGKYISCLHYLNRPLLNRLSGYRFACSDLAGKWLYGSNENFDVVKNGIDTQKYIFNLDIRRNIRNQLSIPQDAYVIGHVGRFTKQKNHQRLLDIFQKFINIKPNTYLILIGNGELEKQIIEHAKYNRFYNNIFFLGERRDIPALMSAMDVFFMPSLYEGLPIAAIEAQASGLKLYMSDTISRETQLIKDVQWFSLKSSNKEIVNLLSKDTTLNESVKYRINQNNIVKVSDFSIISTASYIDEIYSVLIKN